LHFAGPHRFSLTPSVTGWTPMPVRFYPPEPRGLFPCPVKSVIYYFTGDCPVKSVIYYFTGDWPVKSDLLLHRGLPREVCNLLLHRGLAREVGFVTSLGYFLNFNFEF
jgi:hypothetical protein